MEKDGKKNSKLRVVGDRMHLLDHAEAIVLRSSLSGRNQEGRSSNSPDQSDQSGGYDTGSGFGATSAASGSDDDIPF